MKQILLLLFSFASLSVFAQEVEVPEMQKLLITKRTATWCTICGSWGWTLKNGIIEDNADDAAFIAAHYSGNLKTDVSESLTSNFVALGQPRFYVGNVDQNANSGNHPDKRMEIRDQVLASMEKSPTAQAGIQAAAKDQTLQIAVSSKFFEASEGDYYLGVYLVQKEVMNFQAPISGQVVHENVLHSAVTTEWYGELIAEGSAAVGDFQDFFYELELEEGLMWPNLMVLTVIWQLDGSTYEFVNANTLVDIEEGLLVNSNEEITPSFNITALPNPAQDNFSIYVENPPVNAARISVVDALGRQQILLNNQFQFIGENQVIPVPGFADLAAGVYFVVVENGDLRESIMVVKQ